MRGQVDGPLAGDGVEERKRTSQPVVVIGKVSAGEGVRFKQMYSDAWEVSERANGWIQFSTDHDREDAGGRYKVQDKADVQFT